VTKPTVVFQWGASSFFGWGVYGLYLLLNWSRRADIGVASSCFIEPANLAVNQLERVALEPALAASRALTAQLSGSSGRTATASSVVLHALGNNLGSSWSAHNVLLLGTPSLGVVFSETTSFDAEARERGKLYPLIVAGSTWNREVLQAAGFGPVETVLQGVDLTHFHPAPRAGLFEDRFVVFSGGKPEGRKGQDLVVRAFRAFGQRHPDALLVTAWHSPLPKLSETLNRISGLEPIRFRADGRIDADGWTEANGIPAAQVLHLGAVPNAQMPRILREVDVALFPNRAEGGTNLVAMEAMACGVPTILSANTGHLDLIGEGNCYALRRQNPVEGAGCDGWGESDVDEIVETLELSYRDRTDARARGQRGAEMMAGHSWGRQLDALADLIVPFTR
jgi:glycosyltransferase involved in cell wall biosynthesis